MSDVVKRVKRLETAVAAARPPAAPDRPVITEENVNDLPRETVERMMWWLSLRFQVFKPGEDEIRRKFIGTFYRGTRRHPDTVVIEGWRQIYEEEEAAWVAKETRH